jgi:hypothetical protein
MTIHRPPHAVWLIMDSVQPWYMVRGAAAMSHLIVLNSRLMVAI